MNIVVVGAGAMGCLFGGLLKLKGYDITLIDVSIKQIEAINNNGLSIETDAEKYWVGIPAKYAHEITEKAELIIVFAKNLSYKKSYGISQTSYRRKHLYFNRSKRLRQCRKSK